MRISDWSSDVCSSDLGDLLCAAALDGMGITKLPTFIVGPCLRDGRLEVVLPDHPVPEQGIYAVYPHSRNLSLKVRVFVDFLAARFGPEPSWVAGLVLPEAAAPLTLKSGCESPQSLLLPAGHFCNSPHFNV